ncbi:MAG: cytidylate kinase-like family protein [Thermodesulfobacteriota bacterium]|nr:cytidylate kinase-like family protein [Thermodesulfobacteriota bacterium]
MSIITISRGSYSHGKEVAEKVAQALGYECISREIILEASEQFNIPETRLFHALHDSPSVFERFTYGKEKYIAYIRSAFLKHMQKDNIVYHGLAGHFFLKGVSHVLKVRIIADMEDRLREEMERENISAENARYTLKKDDDERRKWSRTLYGIDTWDSSLYDIVLHVQTINVNDIINILLDVVKLPCFQTTPESQRVLDNFTLASWIQASLVEEFPTIKVSAHDGEIFITIIGPLSEEKKITDKAQAIVSKIPDVKQIKVNVMPF